MGINAVRMKAVFFDRDGVLNRAIIREGRPYPPSALADLVVEADAAELLGRLVAAGFLLIGVTNQPDVRRGTQKREVVESINTLLKKALPLLEIRVCYHDEVDHCTCRKPAPGLILGAAVEHGIDPAISFVVGDRWKDIEAGNRAGCQSIWIDRGYSERSPAPGSCVRVHSLKEAVEVILRAAPSVGGVEWVS